MVPPGAGCKGSVAASCIERSEFDKGACRVEAEAATSLKVATSLLAWRNDCTSVLLPTPHEILTGIYQQESCTGQVEPLRG